MSEKKKYSAIISEFGKSEQDTGCIDVQVAILTERINTLNKNHFNVNPKDHASKRGLLKLVGRRKNLLRYLKKRDIEHYRTLIAKLGIRDVI